MRALLANMQKIYSIILLTLLFGCRVNYETIELQDDIKKDFISAALQRTENKVIYNGNYFNIKYPNGDIPKEFGVCTDVIIRSYRKIDVDLQQLVHEDIKENFSKYPIKRHWPNQKTPDTNIDHRRVPNLEIFFSRYGESLPISNNKDDYKEVYH